MRFRLRTLLASWLPKRFGLRTVLMVVTLAGMYFALWDVTKRYGVEHPKYEFGPIRPDGFREVTIHEVGEAAPFPLIIQLQAHPKAEWYLWLFGPKIRLPIETDWPSKRTMEAIRRKSAASQL